MSTESPTTNHLSALPADFIKQSDADQRFMLLLLGRPFSGKSTAAATFPNPLFIDFDHKAPAGANTLPFWDDDFCDKFKPRANKNLPPNRRDALISFLEKNLAKIPKEVTLVVDSGTMIEQAFHYQTETVEPVPMSPKTNKPDGFYVWKMKLPYFGGLLGLLKTHPGNVIYIMHEQPERNEEGMETGRIKPLMSGSFVDSIASHFTLVFRARVDVKNPIDGSPYVWDVVPNSVYECNNTLGIREKTIKAHYASLQKFMKQQ